jgi:hypothetical protein
MLIRIDADLVGKVFLSVASVWIGHMILTAASSLLGNVAAVLACIFLTLINIKLWKPEEKRRFTRHR